MKKYLFVLACTTFLGQDVHAQSFIGDQTLKGKTMEEVAIMGGANLTDIKADTLAIVGTLEFHNLTVAKDTDVAGEVVKSNKGKFGPLKVAGTFEAADVTAESLEVAGTVTATGLTVSKDATIAGELKLKASKDPKAAKNKLNNLTIAAAETSLEDTEVTGNITVKKPKGFDNQVLHLIGKTTVKGTITFESGKGKIEQGSDAKIEGQVTGATVEKK